WTCAPVDVLVHAQLWSRRSVLATSYGPAGSGGDAFDEFRARFLQGQNGARRGRSVDINRLLSKRSHEVIDAAAEIAGRHGQTEVDALHILRILVDSEHVISAVRQAGDDHEDIAHVIEHRLMEALDFVTASYHQLNTTPHLS